MVTTISVRIRPVCTPTPQRAAAVFILAAKLPLAAGPPCSISGSTDAPDDPFGDPKITGDPYRTLFVGRLSRQTDDETLRKAMCRYGRVKSVRLVRDIVTGASRGYAFVEYVTDREMCRAYEEAHHSIIDGSEVIVDYYRQQLKPGWIPRRLGGLGGKRIWSASIWRSREAISGSLAAYSL